MHDSTQHLVTQNRIAKWALFVATLALLATVGNYYWSERQLDEAKAQFALSGPQLTVTSGVSLNSPSAEEGGKAWYDAKDAPVLGTEIFEQYEQVWLRLTVQNTGRMDTTLTGARLRLAPETWLAHDDTDTALTWCTARKGTMTKCADALPTTLVPGLSYDIFFPLHDVRAQLQEVPGPEPSLLAEISATGLRSPTLTEPTGIVLTLPL